MENHWAIGSNFWLKVGLPFKSRLFIKTFPHNIEELRKKTKDPFYLIHFNEPLRTSAPRDFVMKYAHCFDMIFTTDISLIENLDNAHWSPLSDCWTNGSIAVVGQTPLDRTSEVIEKEFSVSFLMTKHVGGNYQIRHDIWNRENDLKVPLKFYDSNSFGLNDGHTKLPKTSNWLSDKIVLYKSMFNICPENFYNDIGPEANFSQKLTDCLLNKTIPIYRGYEKLGEHFNMDGIIWIENGEDAVNKINKLTPEYYHDRKDVIEDNYNKLIEGEFHLNPGKRVANMIKKIYKSK